MRARKCSVSIFGVQIGALHLLGTLALPDHEAFRAFRRYRMVDPEAGPVTLASASQLQVRKPRYLNALSGQSFRDLALHERYAVAVTSSGELMQWGSTRPEHCPSSSHTEQDLCADKRRERPHRPRIEIRADRYIQEASSNNIDLLEAARLQESWCSFRPDDDRKS